MPQPGVRATLALNPKPGCLTVGLGAAQVAQSLGLLIGATVLDAKVAQTVAAVIMLTMMLARPPCVPVY